MCKVASQRADNMLQTRKERRQGMKRVGILLAALILVGGSVFAAYAVDAPVVVTATANQKITIETNTATVNFGAIDPGTPTTKNNAVTVTVKSNKPYNVSYTATDFVAGTWSFPVSNMEFNGPGSGGSWAAFSNSGSLLVGEARGTKSYTYDYRLTIPWDVDPDNPYSATITYTAVQI
jgi:hypothetical protein